MSANILTERQRCARECQWTWWRTDGHFDVGDVRRCEHGRIWRATGGRVLALAGATSYDQWERVPRFTIAHRRAIRALAQDGAR